MVDHVILDSKTVHHIKIHLKKDCVLDTSIFSRMANDEHCLSCMLEDEKSGRLIYNVDGYISLADFISQYTFEKTEGYSFLHLLFESAIACNRNKPVLFDPDFVFVSGFGDHFMFIVLPIQIDAWMFQKKDCLAWIEYISRHMKTTSYEIIGYLLSFIYSEEFSLSNLILGLDALRQLYYPKKFSFFKRKEQSFRIKEPIQPIYQVQSEEPVLEKTQLLNVDMHYGAYLEMDGERFDLCHETNLVGRGMACDIRFADHSVSLKHARITCNEDRYYIQDLKSSNHTRIEAKEVKRKMRLKDGMHVWFGSVECIFHQS